MSPWFSRIISRKKYSSEQANSVKEVIHAREIQTVNAKRRHKETPFVIKYFREPLAKIQEWNAISKNLETIGVPTAGLSEIKNTSKGVYAKQRDYTNSLKQTIKDAREFGVLTPSLANNIVSDLAKMHKKGFVLTAQEHIFSPWIIYEKSPGKLDRVIIDFGSIKPMKSTHFELRGRQRAHAEHNVGILLANLTIFKKPERIELMKHYFSINPDPILKSKASTFLGHDF
ncbi:MAG: hypothetical protein HON47_01370 [Candidatus Diapherotrites archaeon]|jgi:hypothetical protein|uniref:Uncharacterized protein n=1 Tax=Candidatus Iainarchaeum sp. TaxID=3101447 RepID=A0A8T5GE13_9ARCH|nr:hypothetical protein [Candidatus Diapherotrites archaeon]MBT7241439.1 hypothetical protein [Candidatus Diapherotrites archaeon]